MSSTLTHNHVSGKVIKAQVAYASSSVALETAKAIIIIKLRNSSFFLTDYIHSRRRQGFDSARFLSVSQNRLVSLCSEIKHAVDRRRIFLLEAKAAQVYWSAVALLCHQDEEWRRIYPHAGDSLNILLNTGYTFLGRYGLKSLKEVGLLPEIGVLHGENSRDPLLYDFIENFRVIAVDAVIVASLTRRYSGTEKDSPAFGRILARLAKRYGDRFRYRGHCETLERIMYYEAVRLREAVVAKEIWRPYSNYWSHRRSCRR